MFKPKYTITDKLSLAGAKTSAAKRQSDLLYSIWRKPRRLEIKIKWIENKL